MAILEGTQPPQDIPPQQEEHGRGAQGRGDLDRVREDGRDHGPVRFGQEHAHAHLLGLLHSPDPNHGPAPELYLGGENVASLSDNARTRSGPAGWASCSRTSTWSRLSPRSRTSCWPATTPASRARQPGSRPGGPRPRRPGRSSGPQAGRAVRRRAAARRHRSGPRQQAGDHPGRRADRQPRLRSQRRSAGLLRQFNREHGQTIVLVTHDSEVGEACDRVIRMRDGRIRDNGLRAATPMMAADAGAVPA
jgi:hypothetical protein